MNNDTLLMGLEVKCLPYRHKQYPPVVFLTESDRKRILISGGAGFVGSHLVDTLLREGHEVSMHATDTHTLVLLYW